MKTNTVICMKYVSKTIDKLCGRIGFLMFHNLIDEFFMKVAFPKIKRCLPFKIGKK